MMGINRRDFIRGVAGCAAILALDFKGGVASESEIKRWDKEADVVIVGFGGAGGCSAITAHDLGTKVLIIEKEIEGREGGNTRTAVGGIIAPAPDKEESFFKYLKGCDYWDQMEEDIYREMAREFVHNERWIRKMGGDVRVIPFHAEVSAPGSDSLRLAVYGQEGFGFDRMWKSIRKNVINR
ncbi:MAG: FAD-binding protein, partial [Thermodesulfobacteriota bacterium]|nr:FAD-binding protein [Thermodesulfobacteriota bacterium]